MSPEQQYLTVLSEQFQVLSGKHDSDKIRELLDDQNISDVAELINDMPDREIEIIEHLSIHRAASTFKILDHTTQKRIIRELPPYKIVELLNELPADDRTSFLEELPSEAVKELVKLLDPEERRVTLSLLGYKEGSVGRLMTPDYIAVFKDWTVHEVLDHIRTHGKDSETIDVIYVIDEHGRLIDDVRIREFLLASPEKLVSEVMDGRYISLNVNDEETMANDVFKMNNRVALPVVDDHNILLGIVTIDDVLWVTTEAFSEDMQKMGGTEALDEPYLEMPLFRLFKKRIGWLVVLFLGEMLTATAMGFFQNEIEKAVVLALFVPLIISSGGNSGSQAATLIIQALAVGDITLRDWWRIMRREILSGLMLGAVLGTVGFLRIATWSLFSTIYGPHWMMVGLTVGTALIGVVLWGTLAGSMLPLLLKRLGADPAVSSAPFIATLVDVTGLIIYFSVAYIFLQGVFL
ncbi:MAG: magnesium transporter [Bacteroidota bacterium]